MGSDLYMNPPTPDEKRIVRSGRWTAVYTRHTDGIYGDTRTWTRVQLNEDPDGVVLHALKNALHVGTTTLTGAGKHQDDYNLYEKLDFEVLAEKDRDYEAELRRARGAVESQQQSVDRAMQRLTVLTGELAALEAEAAEACA